MLAALCAVLSLVSASALARDIARDDPSNPGSVFVSRPDLQPPQWKIEVLDEGKLEKDGYWFVTPYHTLGGKEGLGWIGPHIYDRNGDLIWSGAHMVEYTNTFEFRPVDGQPTISFLSKRAHAGLILNQDYTVNSTVSLDNFNLHEFKVIDHGRQALTINNHKKKIQIEKPGLFNGTCKIIYQGFQEIDVETGEVLFDWDSEGQIDYDESTYISKEPGKTNNTWIDRCRKSWDITHFNSVDKFANGDYLVSARHADTIFRVSHTDGSILWRLGGVKNDFKFISEKKGAAVFTRQHHARILSENSTHTQITLMDNAAARGSVEAEHFSSNTSWGMILALQTTEAPYTATLVRRYQKPLMDNGAVPLYTSQLGSVSQLKNGNVFIGWGSEGQISEHSYDGTLLMSAYMSVGIKASFDEDGIEVVKSYRAYKMPWVGRPAQPPDVIAEADADRHGNATLAVHVSWNGATEVDRWEMHKTTSLGGASTVLASSPRTGFETKLEYNGLARFIVAVAFDRHGNELGRSPVVTVKVPFALLQDPSLWSEEDSTTSTPPPTTSSSLTPSSTFFFAIAFVGVICFVLGLAYAKWHGWQGWRQLIWKREIDYSRVASEEDGAVSAASSSEKGSEVDEALRPMTRGERNWLFWRR